MARPAMLDSADLAAAASGSLDVAELALGLKAAGISDNHGLAADLMTELREHAQQVALQDREREELLTSGRPHYELPMIPEGIDLASLYQLAAALREQGAACMAPVKLDMDRIIDDRRTRIIVCCGSGGVGKTTAAAAIGLRAAERGRQACVLTVDPARRLAQSMGLTSLDNTPRQVDGVETGQRRQPARDDARHEADVRRDRGGARRPGPGRADPGQPLLPVAVLQLRRDAGVHGHGEARSAQARRRVGPHRGRHPAEPFRARLPRRAAAARPVPRRQADPAADRPGQGRRCPT